MYLNTLIHFFLNISYSTETVSVEMLLQIKLVGTLTCVATLISLIHAVGV